MPGGSPEAGPAGGNPSPPGRGFPTTPPSAEPLPASQGHHLPDFPLAPRNHRVAERPCAETRISAVEAQVIDISALITGQVEKSPAPGYKFMKRKGESQTVFLPRHVHPAMRWQPNTGLCGRIGGSAQEKSREVMDMTIAA